MGKVLIFFTAVFLAAVIALRFVPYFPLAVKVEWMLYFGLAFMFFVAWTTERIFRNVALVIIAGIIGFGVVWVLLHHLLLTFVSPSASGL